RPTTDTDVDVIRLRKDPAVPTRDDAELDHHASRVPLLVDVCVQDVSFEGDAVHDVAAETEGACGRSVGAVRPDERANFDRSAVEAKTLFGLELDSHAVAELGAGIDCAFGEEGVQAAALGHQTERARPAFEGRPVAKTALDARHDVLHHGLDGE